MVYTVQRSDKDGGWRVTLRTTSWAGETRTLFEDASANGDLVADAGHTYRADAPAPSDLAPALVAVWWGDTPEGAAGHIGAEHGAAAGEAGAPSDELHAIPLAVARPTATSATTTKREVMRLC